MGNISSSRNHGVVSITSVYSFADTVRRLLSVFAEHDIKVFAIIDQMAAAVEAGLTMPPTTLIIFGNPRAGTPLMLAQPLCGIDLPLKALVMELTPGQVIVSFNSAMYVLERHSLSLELSENLVAAERLIVDTVTKAN